MIKIHFTKSNRIGGVLIRWFTWSEYNHVAVEVDGRIYESRLFEGVQEKSLNKFLEYEEFVESFDVPLPDQSSFEHFLKQQVGKPYDWRSIFGFLFRRDWSDESSWFCSELVFMALVHGGATLSKMFTENSHRITPRDLRLIVPMLQ